MAGDYGSFYVTLPSNSSLKYFPENSLSTYTTHLPDVMELQGDYEVGLTEIHYPHNWITYKADASWTFQILEASHKIEDGHTIYDGKPVVYDIALETDSFVDLKHLIDTCNSLIKERMYGKTFKIPRIVWDAPTHCVVLNNTVEEQSGKQIVRSINLSPELSHVLGLQQYSYKKKGNSMLRRIGNQNVSLTNHFDQIYLYTDICEECYLGDVKASLLRVIPIKGVPSDTISIIYEKPQYIPVVKNRIQTIQILLRTDTGEPIKFINGRVVVTLHFRRRLSPF